MAIQNKEIQSAKQNRDYGDQLGFHEGFRDGIPICLGYFAVSIAFGIMAAGGGLTILEAVMISFFNLTSAGQFAGLTVMLSAGSLIEMAVTQFVINLRYSLMAIALSQKLDDRFRGLSRWAGAFFITDEIFATSINHEEKITRSYFLALGIMPVLGWSGGTLTGAILGNVLPELVTNALGVALYGMFIAVFVPKARDDKKVLLAVLLAVALSVAIYYVPVLSGISAGFAIIICAVVASAVCAILMPPPQSEESEQPASETAGSEQEE